MDLKPITVFGHGGHAKVVVDLIEQRDDLEVQQVVNLHAAQNENTFLGYPLVSYESFIQDNPKPSLLGIVAVGDNFTRQKWVKQLVQNYPKLDFETLIHPTAIIGRDCKIEPGSVVMAGCIIQVASIIGPHCIVNTGASVDHDCVLGHYASLAPGVRLGGNVSIGTGTAVGIGTSVRHQVRIGNHTVIGAHSYVDAELGDGQVAYGVPCRPRRQRRLSDPYL